MIFRQLFGGGWREGIPRLYPSIDGPELCDWLDDATFEHIRRMQLVMICPFFTESRKKAHLDRFFGAGLARLMIRDLMLIRNISVRGPEDTPMMSKEYAVNISAAESKSKFFRACFCQAPLGQAIRGATFELTARYCLSWFG